MSQLLPTTDEQRLRQVLEQTFPQATFQTNTTSTPAVRVHAKPVEGEDYNTNSNHPARCYGSHVLELDEEDVRHLLDILGEQIRKWEVEK